LSSALTATVTANYLHVYPYRYPTWTEDIQQLPWAKKANLERRASSLSVAQHGESNHHDTKGTAHDHAQRNGGAGVTKPTDSQDADPLASCKPKNQAARRRRSDSAMSNVLRDRSKAALQNRKLNSNRRGSAADAIGVATVPLLPPRVPHDMKPTQRQRRRPGQEGIEQGMQLAARELSVELRTPRDIYNHRKLKGRVVTKRAPHKLKELMPTGACGRDSVASTPPGMHHDDMYGAEEYYCNSRMSTPQDLDGQHLETAGYGSGYRSGYGSVESSSASPYGAPCGSPPGMHGAGSYIHGHREDCQEHLLGSQSQDTKGCGQDTRGCDAGHQGYPDGLPDLPKAGHQGYPDGLPDLPGMHRDSPQEAPEGVLEPGPHAATTSLSRAPGPSTMSRGAVTQSPVSGHSRVQGGLAVRKQQQRTSLVARKASPQRTPPPFGTTGQRIPKSGLESQSRYGASSCGPGLERADSDLSRLPMSTRWSELPGCTWNELPGKDGLEFMQLPAPTSVVRRPTSWSVLNDPNSVVVPHHSPNTRARSMYDCGASQLKTMLQSALRPAGTAA